METNDATTDIIQVETPESDADVLVANDVCHGDNLHVTLNTKSDILKPKNAHKEKKKHICDVCSGTCPSARSLRQHIMSTHPSTIKHVTEKKLNSKKIKKYSCDKCTYKFTYKCLLTRHLRTHSGEKPFSCTICGYRCARKSDLTKHITTHTGVKPFTCEICGYKCAQKSDLSRHMGTHTGVKPFTCDICGYKCALNSNLRRHMGTHTGVK